MGRVRNILTALSIGCFVWALFLPSYTFVSPDHSIDIHQRGFNSLMSPPADGDSLSNILYFALLAILIFFPKARAAQWVFAAPLAGFTGLVCLFSVMGDPQPGSTVDYGAGAWLWLLAIGLGIAATIPGHGQGDKQA